MRTSGWLVVVALVVVSVWAASVVGTGAGTERPAVTDQPGAQEEVGGALLELYPFQRSDAEATVRDVAGTVPGVDGDGSVYALLNDDGRYLVVAPRDTQQGRATVSGQVVPTPGRSIEGVVFTDSVDVRRDGPTVSSDAVRTSGQYDYQVVTIEGRYLQTSVQAVVEETAGRVPVASGAVTSRDGGQPGDLTPPGEVAVATVTEAAESDAVTADVRDRLTRINRLSASAVPLVSRDVTRWAAAEGTVTGIVLPPEVSVPGVDADRRVVYVLDRGIDAERSTSPDAVAERRVTWSESRASSTPGSA